MLHRDLSTVYKTRPSSNGHPPALKLRWTRSAMDSINYLSMKQIYLIRHSTPNVGKGVCYGQSDIDVIDSFADEAAVIKTFLPAQIDAVYSSPLLRCKKLGQYLFPAREIVFENSLMEIHCGSWEMRNWDDIPTAEVMPWMNDFVNVRIPGGESYADLYQRVTACFEKISLDKGESIAIIAHGGVIRSILSHITSTPLADSFQAFRIHYGCAIRLTGAGSNWLPHFLSNIPGDAERHKPSYF